MQQIHLKRGLDIPFDGKAAQKVTSVPQPAVIHVVPDHFAGVKPKLLVKEGDSVKAGSPLFHDKTFEEMFFTSPVSGKVTAIVRGDRRKVMSIDIEADSTVQYETFDTSQDPKGLLLYAGLWPLLRQRPYDCIAMPSKTPKAIFVSTFDSAPVAPDYAWVLKEDLNDLQAGIEALSTLAPVYVGLDGNDIKSVFRSLSHCTQYEVFGPHPAGNVGVQINHVLPIAKGETVYTVNIQDLAVIGRLFSKGIVDMHKTVAVTGPLVKDPQYYNVLPGTSVSSVLSQGIATDKPARYIAGNALSGHQTSLEEMISLYDNQFCVIDEGSETHEFMGWLFPRFKHFSFSFADPAKWLSCCFKKSFGSNHDARLKGGRRAIIVSGEYDKVFPMDIYPEYLIKAMIAGNLDKMEALGAYEVAPEDFALCEYVCTSKMPLQAIVRQALDNLKSEIE